MNEEGKWSVCIAIARGVDSGEEMVAWAMADDVAGIGDYLHDAAHTLPDKLSKRLAMAEAVTSMLAEDDAS